MKYISLLSFALMAWSLGYESAVYFITPENARIEFIVFFATMVAIWITILSIRIEN